MYLKIFNTQNFILSKIFVSSLFLTVFLKFCKFKSRYCYRTYAYNKGKSIFDRTGSTFLLTTVQFEAGRHNRC